MPKVSLKKQMLTQRSLLNTLVENRRVYNLQNCELNIYETYEQSFQQPLTFSDLVITGMLRGKKVMHLPEKPAFDYLPGETVIVSANETMTIDFPEANLNNPSQCIALALDAGYVDETVQFLNNTYNPKDEPYDWQVKFTKYHFENNAEIASSLNKLISICMSSDAAKDIYVDLNLKELLVRLMQSQNLAIVYDDGAIGNNNTRAGFVLDYINNNLTEKIEIDTLSRKAYLSRNVFFKWFKHQFGLTPLDYINRERIRMAKRWLADKRYNITTVSFMCGFTDVNYFVRLFRKSEGVTPGMYRAMCG